MDSSFHEPESGTQKQTTRPFPSLPRLASIIQWLAALVHMTEEEQEQAGIYLDHPGGE